MARKKSQSNKRIGAIGDDIAEQGYLFAPSVVGVATGKSLESLQYSRQQRDEIMRLFGGELPMSIMAARKHGRDSDLGSGTYQDQSIATDEQLAVSQSFWISNVSARAGGLSQFPQNIGRSMVLLYSKPGDTIVDPFAGHNSRMELCVKAGRHYIGQDLSHEFMEWNRQEQLKLKQKFPEINVTLFEGDSRKTQAQDESGDFTLTSPPYWDIEYYGDEPEQLGTGNKNDYEKFLEGLAQVARENFRCLKPSSYCVWFVNDFRKNRKFYPYHVDTLKLLCDAGFEPWDMLITDLGYPIKAAFVTQVVSQHILPKRHEYGIIMKKPPLFPMDERKQPKEEKTGDAWETFDASNLKNTAATQQAQMDMFRDGKKSKKKKIDLSKAPEDTPGEVEEKAQPKQRLDGVEKVCPKCGQMTLFNLAGNWECPFCHYNIMTG